jgi:thiosulfate dehydrogenase
MASIAIVSACVGLMTVAVAITLDRRARDETATGGPPAASAEYGARLLAETAALIGPDHEDPAMRFSGTRMACAACHMDTGTDPGTLSLLEAAARYPRFSGRDGGIRDLQDRINGCLQRSMNGRALPRDSTEILAMVAYIESLRDRFAAMGETARTPTEQAAFATPDRAADLDAGRRVFETRCAVCHGADGAGLPAAGDPGRGYVFPPLLGPDSFNDGAGMHRVLTAARFVKARMPHGQADLTDDEAFDVAAYFNSHPRPRMADLDRDYPDRADKPIDGTYGPFADEFPLEQHRFGPFRPIEEFHAARRGAGDDAAD